MIEPMKLLAAVTTSLVACTSTEPVDYLPGTWERYDNTGRVIDRMTFDAAGTFTSKTFYYHPKGPTLFGDFSEVTGSYAVVGQRVNTRGTTKDGVAFTSEFTFYADDQRFVHGAFVLEPGEQSGDSVRRYTAGNDIDVGLSFDQVVMTRLYLQDYGTSGSYFFDFNHPIWGTPEAETGDWSATGDGGMMFDNTLRYENFDGLALGRYLPYPQSFDGVWYIWDLGLIYDRVPQFQ